jgi:hypothetical protein
MMSLEVGECKGNAPSSNVIGTVVCSKPPLLTALLEISYSSGHSDFAYVNCSLFIAVHRYILDTKRFV